LGIKFQREGGPISTDSLSREKERGKTFAMEEKKPTLQSSCTAEELNHTQLIDE